MTSEDLQVPGYDINERIGRGGMASVYRARQHTFDRDVALKVLKPDLSEDESFCQRFVQESLIVAKLHHSHIVQVYDVGEFQNNFYIAMEYLHGGDLNSRLRKGLPVKDSIEIIKQIASALDFAHQKGIIHRDIKPDNVMFREDGAAVLTDFGIAKEIDSDMNLTQTGLIVGTPKYMSPEQIRGDMATARSDIYSLGILFFQCLTDHVPFEGKDMVATAYKHFNEPVPELPPAVKAMQPIVDKMLEKFPEDRYQRAREVVQELEKLTDSYREFRQTNLDLTEAFIPPHSAMDPTLVHSEKRRDKKISSENLDASVVVPKNPKPFDFRIAVFGGLLLATFVASAYFLVPMKAQQESDTSAPAEQANVLQESPSELYTDKSYTVDRLLREAKQDIREKRLKKPDSNNAYNKLKRVLQLSPDNAEALADMEQIAEEYVKLADAALAKHDIAAARDNLDNARSAAPNLDLIKVIQTKIDKASTVRQNQNASILSMEQSLVIQGLLESAAIDEDDGRIYSPTGENAMEKYRKVLEIDPQNATALEKLKSLKK